MGRMARPAGVLQASPGTASEGALLPGAAPNMES
jgi:hypothetical protein